MEKIVIKYPNTLKQYRLNLNLTQKEVSLKLGLGNSEDRISHWEKGQAMPSAKNLLKLAKVYKVAVDELYPNYS